MLYEAYLVIGGQLPAGTIALIPLTHASTGVLVNPVNPVFVIFLRIYLPRATHKQRASFWGSWGMDLGGRAQSIGLGPLDCNAVAVIFKHGNPSMVPVPTMLWGGAQLPCHTGVLVAERWPQCHDLLHTITATSAVTTHARQLG